MPLHKVTIPFFIKKALESIEESDRKVTARKAESLLEEERRLLSKYVPKNCPENVRQNKKKKQKRHFITGIGNSRYTFFRPAVSLSVQKECEEWWFSLANSDRIEIMNKYAGGGSLREGLIYRSLLASGVVTAERDESKKGNQGGENSISDRLISAVSDTFFKYWPVFVLFFLMSAIFTVNIKIQSGLIALAGFILSFLILWQCRFIKVKKELGLQFFCPLTVFFLLMAFLAEGQERKNIKGPKKQCSSL